MASPANLSPIECGALWIGQGKRLVLATVIRTWRSSPRPVGSEMVIGEDGRFAGSVSGGCVESAVIAQAAAVLTSGQCQSMVFGVSQQQAWEAGLPCGGTIEVFLAPLSEAVASQRQKLQRARTAFVQLTELATGTTFLWVPDGPTPPPVDSDSLRAERLGEVLETGQPQCVQVPGERWFLQPLRCPYRVFIVGAAHLSQALAQLAVAVGYDVVVIDPRTAFSAKERFEDVQLLQSWPDEALQQLGLDQQTAVVVLSHDEKLDDPALTCALRSNCFYIGALGSRRTQQARRERLMEAGFGQRDLERIHGPVGLAIGAKTPHEIATAIVAEIIAVQRTPPVHSTLADSAAELP